MKNNTDLKQVLKSEKFKSHKSRLLLPIGIDNKEKPVFYDLASDGGIMIGGATGSGKSTFLHSTIASLVSRNSADDLKFIFIDPKRVELTIYDKIDDINKYQITPVAQEPNKMYGIFKWTWGEICRRYTNNISPERPYNPSRKMPCIVIMIDELSDLMATDAKFVSRYIQKINEVGQLVGVYMIVASSRPSPKEVYPYDLRKSFNNKIAFQTASKDDAKTILGRKGAELLSGAGQMLFKSGRKTRKLQGFYINTMEEAKSGGIIQELIAEMDKKSQQQSESRDYLYGDAKSIVIKLGKASASLLQRRLGVGYARAALLLDLLEENGVIGPSDGAKPRDILTSSEELTDEERKSLANLNYDNDEIDVKSEDELYEEAKNTVIQVGKASASILQRKLKIGYARAARLLDLLEEAGVIDVGVGAKPRKVFIKPVSSTNSE